MTTKIEGSRPAQPVEASIVSDAGPVRAGGARGTAVAGTPPADSLRLTGEAVGLKAMARDLANPAQLDMAKIKEIRSAIDSGTYEIHPQEIASRLLALERELLG